MSKRAGMVAIVALMTACVYPKLSTSEDWNGGTGTSGAGGSDVNDGSTSGSNGVSGTAGKGGTTGAAGNGGENGTAGKGGTTGVAGTAGAGAMAGVTGTGGAVAMAGAAGSGGAGAMAGMSGTNGAAGRGGAGGTSGTSGSGGSAGGGAVASCAGKGCAVISAPFTGPEQIGLTQITFSSVINLTNKKITIRACATEGDYHSFFMAYVQNPLPNPQGNYGTRIFQRLDLMSCSDGFLDLTMSPANTGSAQDGTFDPASVALINVELWSDGIGPAWVKSTVYIDSITSIDLTSMAPGPMGPYPFTTNFNPLVLNKNDPDFAAGSTLTWLNQ